MCGVHTQCQISLPNMTSISGLLYLQVNVITAPVLLLGITLIVFQFIVEQPAYIAKYCSTVLVLFNQCCPLTKFI